MDPSDELLRLIKSRSKSLATTVRIERRDLECLGLQGGDELEVVVNELKAAGLIEASQEPW